MCICSSLSLGRRGNRPSHLGMSVLCFAVDGLEWGILLSHSLGCSTLGQREGKPRLCLCSSGLWDSYFGRRGLRIIDSHLSCNQTLAEGRFKIVICYNLGSMASHIKVMCCTQPTCFPRQTKQVQRLLRQECHCANKWLFITQWFCLKQEGSGIRAVRSNRWRSHPPEHQKVWLSLQEI